MTILNTKSQACILIAIAGLLLTFLLWPNHKTTLKNDNATSYVKTIQIESHPATSQVEAIQPEVITPSASSNIESPKTEQAPNQDPEPTPRQDPPTTPIPVQIIQNGIKTCTLYSDGSLICV